MKTTWTQWYKKKGYKVEPEVSFIEKLLRDNPSSKILDIGCGHGRHIIYFARKGYNVYGIDNNSSAISKLQKNLSKHGLNAILKTNDFTKSLPYPRNSFDLIIATRSIHHTNTKNVKKIFKEIGKILKSRGLLFLQVPDYEGAKKIEKTWIEYGKPVSHKWSESHTYIPLSGPENGVPHHSFDKEELMQFLRNYEILRLHVGKKHYHGYCVIAKKL